MRWLAGAAAVALWLSPYAWMVLTSLKTPREILEHPGRPYPAEPTATAYREVFAAMPVGRYLGVSLLMALSIAAAQVALALPAGYALAKLRFTGRRFAFAAIVACLLVPAQATFVPVFLLFAKVRLVDTMAALVLPFAASALGTFLVRQALESVPDEVIEAARMDGAPEWAIIYRVVAPMLRPTLVSLFLAPRHDHGRRGPDAAARSGARARARHRRPLEHRHGGQRGPVGPGPRPLRSDAETPAPRDTWALARPPSWGGEIDREERR
jgi:ABC-type glycerol-3-phosphate transport system permease component